MFNLAFFITNALTGTSLAMDAFSASLANGLHEPKMKARRMCLMAGIFSLFQFAMPMIGWVCVHSLASHFKVFADLVPWIALALLSYIGGKMLYDGIKNRDCDCEECMPEVSFKTLIVQGVATSIDALSVGFTICQYGLIQALVACLLIGLVTFIICYAGIIIGKGAGTALAGKAGILGGVILIIIGIKIFVEGVILK